MVRWKSNRIISFIEEKTSTKAIPSCGPEFLGSRAFWGHEQRKGAWGSMAAGELMRGVVF